MAGRCAAEVWDSSHMTWLESDLNHKFEDLRLAWVTLIKDLTWLWLSIHDLRLDWDLRQMTQKDLTFFLELQRRTAASWASPCPYILFYLSDRYEFSLTRSVKNTWRPATLSQLWACYAHLFLRGFGASTVCNCSSNMSSLCVSVFVRESVTASSTHTTGLFCTLIPALLAFWDFHNCVSVIIVLALSQQQVCHLSGV